jgi:putative mRNA 3-end processing factor
LTVRYKEAIYLNGVKVSFYPAGHILGSAQIRIEYKGEVWVISGDYKIEKDFTCDKFEPVKCNTFITESTFGLPIFKWISQTNLFENINSWWRKNKDSGTASVIFGYALGKAQRIISGLDPSIGTIYTHNSIGLINQCYRDSGVNLPPTKDIGEISNEKITPGIMIVAPPTADRLQWTDKFPDISSAFASGWMQIRKNRKRNSFDRGFPLSDHADWEGLLQAIKESEADKILITHGYSSQLSKWLCENGYDAGILKTSLNREGENGL